MTKSKYWKELIKADWIKKGITNETVEWAKKFGSYLAKEHELAYEDDKLKIVKKKKNGNNKERPILTTNQLRKFFGEVKKQQAQSLGANKFNKSEFILLKPKLAYAVARAKDDDAKIHDFYYVLADAIDIVENKNDFKNFIKIFEAIVAYHKAAEESKLYLENN